MASLNKLSVPAATMLGLLFYAQGKTADAQSGTSRRFKSILADPRRPPTTWRWRMYLENGSNSRSGAELAQAAKTILPERPEINDTLGWIYYKKEMYQEAIKALREATSDVPAILCSSITWVWRMRRWATTPRRA